MSRQNKKPEEQARTIKGYAKEKLGKLTNNEKMRRKGRDEKGKQKVEKSRP